MFRTQHYQENYPDQKDRKEGGKFPIIACTVITIFAIATLVLGLILKNPYWVIAGIVPAAIYEAWRTEGFFTKLQSVGILVLVVLEILAIMKVIRLNLGQGFEDQEIWVGGFTVLLGDIRFLIPIVMVILSLGLLWRTYGMYTKWLSVVLTANSVVLLYLVNKKALISIIQNFF